MQTYITLRHANFYRTATVSELGTVLGIQVYPILSSCLPYSIIIEYTLSFWVNWVQMLYLSTQFLIEYEYEYKNFGEI